jgi:gluconokinase
MIAVMMGVCGTGKTSVGQIVASRMGWIFIEGDDLHPAANREKMASPWLDRITDRMRALDQAGQSAVIACSALRQVYRDRLRRSGAQIIFLHLTGDANVIRQRMEGRTGHYMPPGLLDSQLATLEPALPGETLHQIDISGTVEGITEAAIRSLSGGTAPAG